VKKSPNLRSSPGSYCQKPVPAKRTTDKEVSFLCSHFVITAQCDNANHGSTHTIEYRLHSRRSTFYLPPDRGAYSRSTVFRGLCLGYGFHICLSFSVHFLVR
jgi:hypothetical protein